MSSPNLESTHGALLIGVFVSFFFQGILSLQVCMYYETFFEDSRKLKTLVAIVWTLDFAHLVLICQAVYYYLIRNWGNNAALMEMTIPLDLHLIFLALSSMACQAFFLHRVWRFSKNKLLTGILSAACLTTGILDIFMARQSIHNTSIGAIVSRGCTGEVVAVFAVGAAVDLSIAGILCWYLQREMTMFSRINSLITRIIQYTLATGLATSLLALGCLVAYVVSPNSLIYLAMHFSLGRMYTNALLATLNSRKTLRAHLAPACPSKWADFSPTQSAPVFGMPSENVTQEFQIKTIGGRTLSGPDTFGPMV
ncbi:ANK-REP-REGION domain-containing protein [Mycena venus]|uniref:ANK-REP-REGION domain-containing protein n=1 Tax=Mycena venus TaxID=2733690 RepID=A0A8H7DEA3_9AGAR|nr:ANK-REP-REGION domain-containing protein [Mycena venus]